MLGGETIERAAISITRAAISTDRYRASIVSSSFVAESVLMSDLSRRCPGASAITFAITESLMRAAQDVRETAECHLEAFKLRASKAN